MNEIGERIYKRRKELKMTQRDLAEMIDVSRLRKCCYDCHYPDLELYEYLNQTKGEKDYLF